MVIFRDKGKETYLARLKCTYLATSQMIRVNDKYKSKMAEILLFGRSRAHWRIMQIRIVLIKFTGYIQFLSIKL